MKAKYLLVLALLPLASCQVPETVEPSPVEESGGMLAKLGVVPTVVRRVNSGNPANVSEALEQINPPNGSDLSNVLQPLDPFTLPTSFFALSVMNPAQFTALAITQQETTLSALNGVSQRLYVNRLCGRCACSGQVWGMGTGGLSWVREREFLTGWSAPHLEVIGGADYAPTNDSIIGLFGGYSRASIDWYVQGSGGIDSVYGGGYYTKECGPLYASVTGHVALSGYETTRRIKYLSIDRRAHATHFGFQAGLLSEFGMRMAYRNVNIEPFGAVGYIHLWENGYVEDGAISLNLQVSAKKSDMLRTELGSRFLFPRWYNPYLTVGWVNQARFKGQLVESAFEGTGVLYTVRGQNWSRSTAHLGIGILQIPCSKCMQFTLAYDGDFARHYYSNRITFELAAR